MDGPLPPLSDLSDDYCTSRSAKTRQNSLLPKTLADFVQHRNDPFKVHLCIAAAAEAIPGKWVRLLTENQTIWETRNTPTSSLNTLQPDAGRDLFQNSRAKQLHQAIVGPGLRSLETRLIVSYGKPIRLWAWGLITSKSRQDAISR